MKITKVPVNVVLPAYRCFVPFPLLMHLLLLFSFHSCLPSFYSFKLSLVIASNLAQQIKQPTRRYLISTESWLNLTYSLYSFYFLRVSTLVAWLYVLIHLSGDVHKNPGQELHYSSFNNTSMISGSSDLQIILSLPNHLSVIHYNVQSLKNKLDVLALELSCFDVIALSGPTI